MLTTMLGVFSIVTNLVAANLNIKDGNKNGCIFHLILFSISLVVLIVYWKVRYETTRKL